jgi:hypothetical protein
MDEEQHYIAIAIENVNDVSISWKDEMEGGSVADAKKYLQNFSDDAILGAEWDESYSEVCSIFQRRPETPEEAKCRVEKTERIRLAMAVNRKTEREWQQDRTPDGAANIQNRTELLRDFRSFTCTYLELTEEDYDKLCSTDELTNLMSDLQNLYAVWRNTKTPPMSIMDRIKDDILCALRTPPQEKAECNIQLACLNQR